MIIIPMAGASSRFINAGYKRPKYQLQIHDNTLFYHSVNSFKNYFKTEKFLFVSLKANDDRRFIENECNKLGIGEYQIIELLDVTRGQAETVFLGLKAADYKENEDLLIFNIDTIRPNFCFSNYRYDNGSSGYLETFIGEGQNWSNILPKNNANNIVARTAEKEEISKYCCTGIYYFRNVSDFIEIFIKAKLEGTDALVHKEFYVAPLYNYLISTGHNINYTVIDKSQVIFCGTPNEYEALIEQSALNLE